jgi:hypothetical protein
MQQFYERDDSNLETILSTAAMLTPASRVIGTTLPLLSRLFIEGSKIRKAIDATAPIVNKFGDVLERVGESAFIGDTVIKTAKVLDTMSPRIQSSTMAKSIQPEFNIMKVLSNVSKQEDAILCENQERVNPQSCTKKA